MNSSKFKVQSSRFADSAILNFVYQTYLGPLNLEHGALN